MKSVGRQLRPRCDVTATRPREKTYVHSGSFQLIDFQEPQSFYQNRHADLQQLGSALQSGDLNGAQQAYSAIAALGQSGPFASSQPFSKSSRTQAFEDIGQALQSGDLAGAQAAFATLTSSQSNSTSSSQATPPAVVNLTRTAHLAQILRVHPPRRRSSSTSVRGAVLRPLLPRRSRSIAAAAVQEHRSPFDPAQRQNSGSAEQLTINLNQQSNYELILNLLNSTSTSQTQSSSNNALSVQA